MIFLFFFGMNLERVVGRRTFFSIFILSGIVGNMGYLLTAYFIPGIDPSTPAVGASGAIYGIMGTLVVLAPLLKAYIFGLIPVPLIILIIFFIFLDFFGLFAPSGIANGAHLGGMIVGIVFGFHIRRKIKRQFYYQG
jgi:membrane associated rhomboid family serine protease